MTLTVIILLTVSLTSYYAHGKQKNSDINLSGNLTQEKSFDVFIKEKTIIATLQISDIKKGRTMSVWATAYSSDVNQTDDTPFITASGIHVYDGVIATNFLPIGTKIIIPELFGNKIFTVEDRMNPRYNGKKIIDIWFSKKIDAKKFGKKIIKIEILYYKIISNNT